MSDASRHGRIEWLRKEYRRWGLTDDDFRALNEIACHKVYDRGEAISEPSGGMLILLQGAIELCVVSACGRKAVLAYEWQTGGIVEIGSIQTGGEGDVWVEVLVDETELYHIAWRELQELMRRRPCVGLVYAQVEQMQRLQRERIVKETLLCSRKARLAHRLSTLTMNEGEAKVVKITHAQLADIVGARQEHVTKDLHELRDEGLISFHAHQPRRIEIADVCGLANYES